MKKPIFIAILVVLVVTVASYGVWNGFIADKTCCSGKSCAQEGSYSSKMSFVCEMSCAARDVDPSKVIANSEAKPGDFTQCPVSGVVFSVTESASKISYKGKDYHTCCGTCAGMFAESESDFTANLR